MNCIFTKRSNRLELQMVFSLLLIFISVFAYPALPLHNNVQFERIYYNDNTSFGIVESIEQDQFGFIWIGTKDGLFRYDGIRYRSYIFDHEDTTSISNNVIRKIFVDSKNNMWVATEFGLNLYIPEKDCFTRFFEKKDSPYSPSSNFITEIAEDKQGNLWMSTNSGGLCMRDTKTGKFTVYSPNSPLSRRISSNFLNTVFISSDGTIWIGTGNSGVDYFKPGGPIYSLKPGPMNGANLSGSNIMCIIENPDNTIWFGTNGNGMSTYNTKSKKFNYFKYSPNNPGSIRSDIISDFFIDSKNNFWICTDGGGLSLFNKEKKAFINYKHRLDDENSISSNIVRTIFEDNSGNIWIGNFNSPINYIDCNRKKFYTIRNTQNCTNCLNGNYVNSIFVDSRNLIWIGVDGGGLNVYDPATEKFKAFLHNSNSSSSVSNNKPLCFTEDQEGNIWIGLFEGGLSCFQRKSGTFRNFFPDGTTNNPTGSQIWDLLVNGNELWLATEVGVDILDLKRKVFNHIQVDTTGKKGISTYSTWKIYKDSKDRILIGTINGLNVYDPNTKLFDYYEPDLANPLSISDKWVISIFEDSQHRIWIGTNGGGLNLWVQPENKFKCFTSKDGLSGNVINDIEEDNSGNLWVSTNFGLTKFNYDSLKFENFSSKDGLQDDRFNINTSFKDKDGILYFGGINGLTFFNPSEITANFTVPPIVFTGLNLYNSEVKINSSNSPLKKNILFQKEIKLTHKQSVFTIDFASLNYTQPKKNLYKYKLEDIDENWRPATNKNSATYTHLKPGHYTFKVIGSNNDNVWNLQGASIDIIITPPFYKTWLFIILEIIIAFLLLFLIYNFRHTTIRQSNHKLSGLVEERTQILKSQKQEIEDQNKEITAQRDLATAQFDQIIRQNEELEAHRSNLADLIQTKTKELLEAKQRAEDNNNLKTIFLEIINHEIRTPMNAILGFINLLSEKIDDPTSRSFYLKILNESGKNLLHLIEDITDFSRFHTGELNIACAPCNLNEMIKNLLGVYREKVAREKTSLNILIDIPEESLIVNSDEKKISQILNHLMDNSFRFTDKGYIKIGIRSNNNDFVTLFVEDSGICISEENMNDFFDRFYSAHHNNQDISQRDSGLGLALSKHLTGLLGGKIWIENLDSKGVIFSFTISRNIQSDVQESIKQKNISTSYYWPGKKIIVAEDDETNYLLIEAMFKDTGLELLHAEDGVEFLEFIEKFPDIDLVLLDIRMPRMNGLNAIKIVRESLKDVPVIAQTAYDHAYHREKAFESGCNHFLTKPLRKEELLNLVKTYLG